MKLLKLTRSTENKTLGNTQNIIYSDPTTVHILEKRNRIQNFFFCNIFLLDFLVDKYTGKNISINMCGIQEREMEKPMNLGVLTMRSFQQEFLGLMEIAWKTLKRQVVLMDMLLPGLRIYKITLHPTSLKNLFHSKAPVICSIPLERMIKEFTVNTHVRIKSMVFNVPSL